MAVIPEGRGILADAEKDLPELIQRELRARRYAEVADLARMADALAQLARGNSHPVPPGNVPARSFTATHESASVPAQRKVIAKRSSTAKLAYPRFERDDEKLVKVGWSKRTREEYEHRAPRAAVLAFSEHIGTQTTKGKTFAVDDLLPVHDAAGEELPSYQVYLALAWLRQAGSVEKKGRDGYVRTSDSLDESVFDTLWDQIPERS